MVAFRSAQRYLPHRFGCRFGPVYLSCPLKGKLEAQRAASLLITGAEFAVPNVIGDPGTGVAIDDFRATLAAQDGMPERQERCAD